MILETYVVVAADIFWAVHESGPVIYVQKSQNLKR